MSRRYYRRRKKNDLITPLGVIVGLFALSTYYKLTGTQKEDLNLGIVFLATVCIVLAVFFKIMQHEIVRKKVRALELADIDNLSGLEFEKYVAKILKSRGCANVKLTEYYDWGVDIIAEKDGVRWGVQVKRYSGAVKAAAVRQAVTALNKYDCSRAMVVTNSYYSRQARELARSNNCILIDRNTLADWIIAFQGKANS